MERSAVLGKGVEMDSCLKTRAGQRGNPHRIALYFLSVVAAGLCPDPVRADSTTPTEYEVKAAFIYNFAKYVRWPEASTSKTRKPFVIGVIGKDPFGRALDDAVRGQSLQGRAVSVKRFGTVVEVADCDILFISSSEKNNLPRILEVLHEASVLTIGDMDRFAERGGMINLTTEEARVRFEINVEAAERAGLKPGSQLLRLARIVSDSRTGR